MAEDYYKTLGVSREASADEIRKSYRKLSKENHPDANPDDKSAAKRFQEVQEAYGVLGNAEKRAQYDRYGHAFQGAAGGGPQYRWSSGGGGGAGPVDIGDIFGEGFDLNDLFGGMGGGGGGGRRSASPRPRRGADVRTEITVPFHVAAKGGNYDLTLNREGRTETISVKVPAGVADGSTIRLSGQGSPGSGAGASAGDLLITVHAAAHPYFRRDGNNLLVDVPLTPAEAALGAKVDVPTLDEGTIVLTIPPGTSTGKKLRLRGKGIPDRKTGTPGDQFVVAKVVVPESLTDEQRAAYESLRDVGAGNPRDGLW
ncbi:DnaJ C-terminal domain-containing protein [Calycomorphotria hydatis]|uniref:Curved DNA-binding protein n=1 Tax=Calycomorphotria hydatis TaxID=2528027 RepID=A0A517TDI3_9PLAN|nr:DnaJ C-terminal domain-containing protein [Calycomorphotria hydatis]QDT66435.1 Curved DNA-binding protein [Calycomorphotria hydatis]